MLYPCDNAYLKEVIACSKSYSEYISNLYSYILSIDYNSEMYATLYEARKKLLQNKIGFDIESYLRKSNFKGNEEIYYLTDNTKSERERILRIICISGKIPDNLDNILPVLCTYLETYNFKCDNSDELKNYFDEYKRLKVLNILTDDFKEHVYELANNETKIYTSFPARNLVVSKFDKSTTYLYWIDSLGLEYLSYIRERANSMKLKINVTVTIASLPTITSVNSSFYYNVWNADSKDCTKKLDEIKHDYNAAGYVDENQKLTMLTRLLPFVEKRLNLIELAPKGTGKSYVFGRISRYGWLSSGGVMSRAKMFYDISKRTEGLVSGHDLITLDEVQTISFTDVDEMRAALKGYLESGVFTVGNYEGTATAGMVLCGNISKETMEQDGTTDMFYELPAVFHESALIERFHGFIKGWNIPRMTDDLKICDWALNSEYFCSILHELREDTSYRAIVDDLIIVPDGADTRDTEAVKRISTAYLKLLFPKVRCAANVNPLEFKRYCLKRAISMRAIIRNQLGIMDSEYRGKDVPDFKVREC